MAGPWLKIECATPDKPHMLAITAAMGWDDPDLAFAKLFRLWRWFDQHTIDGNAAGVTPALLDRVIGVSGFVQAVANVGWVVITDQGISLARFDEHNGDTAKSRAQTAKRVAEHKANAKGNGEANANGNATGVTKSVPRGRGRSNTPKPPEGGNAAVSLKTWAEERKAAGEVLIPDDDPVFTYAEEVGIPDDFMALAWVEFKHRYTQPGAKRYKDWRSVFRKAVRGNWLKLWFLDGDGYRLTTVGQQAQRARATA